MNDIIKKQLLALKAEEVSEWDDNSTEIIIKKPTHIVVQENKCYLIELNNSLLIPNNQSTLTINWNNGSIPTNKWYKIDVSKIMAKMIKINGLAFDYPNNIDLNIMWSGWLPLNEIKILEEI